MKALHYRFAKKQRGSALVVVLLIFALAFALSVEVVYRQHRVQTRTANLLDWDYRYQYAIAAETLAIQALIDDYEDDQRNNEMVDDCSKEKWAGPFTFPYEDAVISATVQDLQGRFNLNSLVVFNNNEYQRDPEAITRLETLLVAVLPPSHTRYASPLANEMADWLDTDTLVNGPEGAEDGEYRLRRTPNQPILDESEFRALRSFDAELAEAINAMQKPQTQTRTQTGTTNNPGPLRFSDYFTALPLGTPLNVNTAPKAVLEAWLAPYNAQAAAQTIVQDREASPYTDLNTILALPALSELTPDQRSALQAQLGVGTSHFQVVIEVAMESGLSRLVTRIQRSPQGDTRVFSRSLVPVLSALEPACNPD